jgi:hypothetical protein
MIASLPDHFNYVYAEDPEIPLFLRRSGSRTASRYLDALRSVEKRSRQLPSSTSERSLLHFRAVRQSAELLSAIAERDCASTPDPAEWAAFARDREQLLALYRESHLLIGAALRAARIPGLRFYGGVKSRAAIESKLRRHSITGEPLDLLDCVRFRVVVPDLSAVLVLSQLIWKVFEEIIIRCRNYYVRPRQGWNDPYRGIHYALQIGPSPVHIVELQVLTLAKDTVGLVDHALVHHGSLPFVGRGHRLLLKNIS